MTRLLIATLLATALAAPPALADPGPARSMAQREARIGQRIEEAARDHELTRAQADKRRAELRKIQRLERYYRRSDGLSAWERRDLERRLKALSERIL
jgi:Ni/Co efflux regulator RcnB